MNGLIHGFDSEVAKKYGVEEAIFLNHIRHWVLINRADGRNYKAGKTWTFNSVRAYAKNFPYWTARQIGRIIANLIRQKVLQSGDFNDEWSDRTRWYSFVDEDAWVGKDDSCKPLHESNSPNGEIPFNQTVKCHSTETSNVISPNGELSIQLNTQLETQLNDTPVTAEMVYKEYPKKVARPEALKAIQKSFKIKPAKEILELTIRYAGIVKGANMQYVPNPASWFNAQRFADDPETWKIHSYPNGNRLRKPQLVATVEDHQAGFFPE